MIGLGIGLKFGGAVTIDQQAQDHFNRVIADGGTIPAGLVGCDAWFKAVKGVYGVSDITSAISSGIHPHYLGYKAGAGSGATLGSAAQTCYNAIGSTGDVVQTTAASQPLILPHTGTNYTWLPGVAGNFFSTPNASSNRIVGDLEIISSIKYLSHSTQQAIISKHESGQRQYSFQIIASNLRLELSADGININNYLSNANIPYPANTLFYAKVTRSATTGDINFYTSLDNITYTQLGTTISGFTGNLFNGTSEVRVGAVGNFVVPTGNIYRITIANTIGGNPVVDFNPANYSRATSGTTWTSTTGEVWTINTPSTNNALKAAIVDTTYLMGNGTSIGMRAASLNMNQTGIASYTAIRKFVNTIGGQIITELGADINTNQGFYSTINEISNQETIAIRANIGIYNSFYTSTSLALKLITSIRDITQGNETSPYLVNNVNQTFVTSTATANNTTSMNGTGYNLLARNNAASAWANVMMACDIVSKNADSTGTQTAMYTALKPFLVNAI